MRGVYGRNRTAGGVARVVFCLVKTRESNAMGEKKRGRSRVKDLETSFDEGVTSRRQKHNRYSAIHSLQIAQLIV